MLKKYLFFILLMCQPSLLFALSGNEMEAIANSYLNHQWKCNIWNARKDTKYDNRDDNPANNNLNFPFFPVGAAYYDSVTGKEVIEDDGIYTGEAYAFGYNDDLATFDSKLLQGNTYAGKADIDVNDGHKFTGIDCSAFVARCTGINVDKIGTVHLGRSDFTDAISWDEVVKGDILVKPTHHVALVSSRSGNTANVIEAAAGYKPPEALKSRRVMVNTYSYNNGIILRDNEPSNQEGSYEPRRIAPPILEKITIKKEETNTVLYQASWEKWLGERKLIATPDYQIIPAAAGDVILFELEFSKAMDHNKSITVTFGPGSPYNQYAIAPLNNGAGGWSNVVDFTPGKGYKKWTGVFLVPGDSSYKGYHHISVSATSITNCVLDSNPGDIAVRTTSGGWDKYQDSTADTTHYFAIDKPTATLNIIPADWSSNKGGFNLSTGADYGYPSAYIETTVVANYQDTTNKQQQVYNYSGSVNLPYTQNISFNLPNNTYSALVSIKMYDSSHNTMYTKEGVIHVPNTIDNTPELYFEDQDVKIADIEPPLYFVKGLNPVHFDLTSSIPYLSGEVFAQLVDSDNNVVSQLVVPFADMYNSKGFDINLPINELKLYDESDPHKYTLKYKVASNYLSQIAINGCSFPEYRKMYEINGVQIKEYFKYAIDTKQKGINCWFEATNLSPDFKTDSVRMTIAAPAFDYEYTTDISLNETNSFTIPLSVYPIGTSKIHITLDADNTLTKDFDITIQNPLSYIIGNLDKLTFNTGEQCSINLLNPTDQNLSLNYRLSVSKNDNVYLNKSGTIMLLGNNAINALKFELPGILSKGWHTIALNVTTPDSSARTFVYSVFLTNGSASQVDITVPQWAYKSSEDVLVNNSLDGELGNSKIKIKIYKYNEATETYSGFSDDLACGPIISDSKGVWLQDGFMGANLYHYDQETTTWSDTEINGYSGFDFAVNSEDIWWPNWVADMKVNKTTRMIGEKYDHYSSYAVRLDGERYIWFTNPYGLIRQDLLKLTDSTTYFTYPVYNGTFLALDVDASDVWVGMTVDGLYKMDKNTGQWENFTKDTNGLPSNYVNHVKIIGNDVWCATRQGIARFNKTTRTCENFDYSTDPYKSWYYYIVYDKPYVWFIGTGLLRYNYKTDEWKRFYEGGVLSNLYGYGAADGHGLWLSIPYRNGIERIKTTGELVYENLFDSSSSIYNLGKFNEGEYVIIAELTDSNGQVLSNAKNSFFVFEKDDIPPSTTIHTSAPVYQSEGITYVSDTTNIYFVAVDSASSEVEYTEYCIDSSTWTIFTSSFTLSGEGEHSIKYRSKDKTGNLEDTRQFVYCLDLTPSESSFQVTDDRYQMTEGTTTYVNNHSTFTLTAVEPISNGVASGLKQMQYSVDDGPYSIFLSTCSLINLSTAPDGSHTVSYNSIDNVENTETTKFYTAIFDGTKPEVKETKPQNIAMVSTKQLTAIKITFSEPVRCDNWQEALIIEETRTKDWKKKRRNYAEPWETETETERKKDFTLSYDSTTCAITISGKFKNNRKYTITLKNTITDKVYNSLNEYQFTFHTMLSAKEGGTIQDEETGLILFIPPNTLPCDGYFETKIIAQENPPQIPKPLEWLFAGRKAYQIIFRNEEGEIVKEETQQAYKMIIVLKNHWIGLSADQGQSQEPIDPTYLQLYQTGTPEDIAIFQKNQAVLYNGETSRLQKPVLLSSQQINTQEEELEAEVDGFGVFGLAIYRTPEKSLDDLSGYPSPFDPYSQRCTIQYYLEHESDAAIAIYDLLGNLVRTWELSGGEQNSRVGLNQLTWDGKNDAGDIVANGGYIVFVHADGQKKKFKVMVVK